MMHENMGITDRLYGKLSRNDVKEIIFGKFEDAISKTNIELYKEFMAFEKWRREIQGD